MRVRYIAMVALIVVVSACSGVVDIGPAATVSDTLEFTESVDLLFVNNPAGKVDIEGSDTNGITVERTIRYTNDQPETTAEVRDGTLTLDIDCGARRRCEVDYEIRIPSDVALEINLASAAVSASGISGGVRIAAASGSVRLTDINGDVDISSASGSIRLTDVNGDLDLNTASGSIDGSGLVAADVAAHSASGTVDLAFDAEVTDLVIETASGSVAVSVPGGPYRVETGTSSGDVDVSIATDPGEDQTIEINTASGDITIGGA